jgi:hypothetical protein
MIKQFKKKLIIINQNLRQQTATTSKILNMGSELSVQEVSWKTM